MSKSTFSSCLLLCCGLGNKPFSNLHKQLLVMFGSRAYLGSHNLQEFDKSNHLTKPQPSTAVGL
ncbi:hypothetical protein EPI10_032772 [Gossypium australe]|uniref:Uncharacterized protein n=1 Tax=Gossypium australe TaxID=47621 RepID=A0A5B6X4D0_9ROSI|nr:hypothetical protein EPI10_032772 [Gossypium australe]